MATNPIYVETEEEIPEVVERLRRLPSDDTMLVLPMRSRIGQSRFNFQLLRNYAARMGKRVTVVCDDPAVQKMASETGFAVFGAIGAQGEGIPSEPEAPPPPRRWWQPRAATQATHVGVVARSGLQILGAHPVFDPQEEPSYGVVVSGEDDHRQPVQRSDRIGRGDDTAKVVDANRRGVQIRRP